MEERNIEMSRRLLPDFNNLSLAILRFTTPRRRRGAPYVRLCRFPLDLALASTICTRTPPIASLPPTAACLAFSLRRVPSSLSLINIVNMSPKIYRQRHSYTRCCPLIALLVSSVVRWNNLWLTCLHLRHLRSFTSVPLTISEL